MVLGAFEPPVEIRCADNEWEQTEGNASNCHSSHNFGALGQFVLHILESVLFVEHLFNKSVLSITLLVFGINWRNSRR